MSGPARSATEPAAKRGPEPLRVVSAEIQRDGEWLIVQRSAHGVLPLLWEFPGGRVRSGENDRDALHRAVSQRIGCAVDVRDRILEVRHDYEGWSVVLAVYRCALARGDGAEGASPEPFARTVNAVAWVRPEDFADYPFPPADQRTVDLLLAGDPSEPIPIEP